MADPLTDRGVFVVQRGFGLAGSRYQTMVKPAMAAPTKSTSLWSRLGLQAAKPTKQPLVYSTKARVRVFLRCCNAFGVAIQAAIVV